MSNRSRRPSNEYYRLLSQRERELMTAMLSDTRRKLDNTTDSSEQKRLQSAIGSISRELAADREGFVAWQKLSRRLERTKARNNEE